MCPFAIIQRHDIPYDHQRSMSLSLNNFQLFSFLLPYHVHAIKTFRHLRQDHHNLQRLSVIKSFKRFSIFCINYSITIGIFLCWIRKHRNNCFQIYINSCFWFKLRCPWRINIRFCSYFFKLNLSAEIKLFTIRITVIVLISFTIRW